VVVERLVAGGDGLARLADGRVVFVEGALPGERVLVEVVRSRRDYANGRVVTFITEGPDRVAPPCPHVPQGCGGCDWQHIDQSAQLDHKVSIVREAFARTGRLEHPWLDGGGSVPPWGYRTTARLAARPDGRLGLRGRRSHEVVALDQCDVLHPRLAAVLPELRAHGRGEITLRWSVATGAMTAALDPGVRLTGDEEVVAAIDASPDASLVERVSGVDLRVRARSFFQSGPAAAELLVGAVRRAAGPALDGVVIDAYGGVGLFSAALGVTDGVLVEASPDACADARHNLARSNVQVERSAVEEWRPVPAGLVIADPARDGLGRSGAAAIVATQAARVVLVGCDPVATARDGRLLVEHGYRPAGALVLDLFPQTHHVEVVARYDRRHNDEFEFW
jgi:23S rRNA (uracil1939-C5)-methyltransferase